MDERRLASPFRSPNAALIEKSIVLLLFVTFLSGLLLVVLPFCVGLVFGGVVAIATWPLRQFLRAFGLTPGWTATALLVAFLTFAAAPILLIGPRLGGEIVRIFDMVGAWLETAPPPPQWITAIPLVGDSFQEQWIKAFKSDTKLSEIVAHYAGLLRRVAIATARGLGDSLLQLLVTLVFATMFWVHGDSLAAAAAGVLRRVGGPQLAILASVSVNAVRGVVFGVIGTASIQGLFMAIGFWSFGIPGALPAGFLTLMLAISQIGGPFINLIWAGGAYWLHLNGQTGALFWAFVTWGLLVTFIDSVTTPFLIGARIQMPIVLVMVGVLGGFLSFGFLGLFVGPALIAVAHALFIAWRTRCDLCIDRPSDPSEGC